MWRRLGFYDYASLLQGVPGDRGIGVDIGAAAGGRGVQARTRPGLDSGGALGGGNRHGGDGRGAAQRLVPREGDFPLGPGAVAGDAVTALAQPEEARATPQETKHPLHSLRPSGHEARPC